ncbi:alpha/beta hydrolase family protein [Maricaulis sp. MIT060901]|jgi:hypothetical protein|uniref:alpha/beta hydrolase family protein n=1 Tax=Maricaulis sp. MIT060901 TaxID=3096993 RepID=UPI00399961C0
MAWLKIYFVTLMFVFAGTACAVAQDNTTQTRDFTFETQGQTLSGLIDTPASGNAEALIIFVHGYGGTDIRTRNPYSQLRDRFAELGITTVVWDKPGQGESEGEFDINQPVASSAQEVVDAARHLRETGVAGADKIGLWGISRAGWIAPLALAQDSEISFWISVSGATVEDNYFYLLMSNLPCEGSSEEEAATIREEWLNGYRIFRSGGTQDEFSAATETLRANAYIQSMRGDWWNQIDYEAAQRELIAAGDSAPYDKVNGQFISVPNLETLLSNLDVDTLALFGDRDRNIDWRQVYALYDETLGQNPEASLQQHVFEGADHVITLAETGCIREMRARQSSVKPDGYYQMQLDWLREVVLSD